jgi:uncharacterized membrane protein YphA (DoxX/SURF4 family)
MKDMGDSMARPQGAVGPADLPMWKRFASHTASLLTAILFLVSGVWKIIDPFTFRTLVEQLKVPYALSTPLTLSLGVGETFAAVLILVPRFRRWGAWLAVLMLVGFMGYMAVNYSTLSGKDCSCFPFVKRAVSPGFFISDAVMVLIAALAAWWSEKSTGVRNALVVLGAIAVFSAVSFGVNAARQSGADAPESVVVDGRPFQLRHGKIFLYFYDPQCMHCEAAARAMSKMNWGDSKVIAIPTAEPQYAASFLRDTGLKAGTSLEFEKLKQAFPFKTNPPYGVVLEDGRTKGPVRRFDADEPEASLRKFGLIQ